jgi:membrane associated rhomboid family serine protease
VNDSPVWLSRLERKFPALRAIGVPNLAILLVTLQALGFLLVLNEPAWVERLALLPSAVLEDGEYWRLITYLSLPLSTSPIWTLLGLWFLYSIVNSLEELWGDFKTTFYVLLSILISITYSLATGYPITHARDFESTLFLAAAALFPEQQVLLLVFPVKMKWLAWLTVALAGLSFGRGLLQGDWRHCGYLLAIFSNTLLFFGPALTGTIRRSLRRNRFRGR